MAQRFDASEPQVWVSVRWKEHVPGAYVAGPEEGEEVGREEVPEGIGILSVSVDGPAGPAGWLPPLGVKPVPA